MPLRRLSSSRMEYSLYVNRSGLSCTDAMRVSKSTTRSPVRIVDRRLGADPWLPTAADVRSATASGSIRTSKFVDCTQDSEWRCLGQPPGHCLRVNVAFV